MKKLILAIFIFSGLIIAANGLFVVYECEQAFVTRFGKPIGERLTAGLHFKTPFIEDVTRFESRILKWDGDPNQIPTKDKRYIWADSTARWRITDPLVFFKTVATVRGAKSRLDDIIDRWSETQFRAITWTTLSEVLTIKPRRRFGRLKDRRNKARRNQQRAQKSRRHN